MERLRRIAERGLRLAQPGAEYGDKVSGAANKIAHQQHLDLWQHMLDELERVETYMEREGDGSD